MSKGFIFKCTSKSEAECTQGMLFGADRLAGDEVLAIRPGDSLFLFNLDADTLSGVYEATTEGTRNIVPKAWRGRYPYQVRVHPLRETKTIGRAKETLTAMSIKSHRLLRDFEVEALDALLASCPQSQPSLNGECSKEELSQIIRKLNLSRKGHGIAPNDDERPPLESTTLWDYPKQSYGRMPKGNNKYAGVTPAFIIYNLVKRYTNPGDLVLDPMCGSGTTIDVCNEEGRRVIGYDIVPTRPDIVKNDARHIPLHDNSVDLMFIDSPYGDNIKYNDAPESIGNISAETEEFYDALEQVMNEALRVLKPGKVLGWLIGDQWVKKRFTPVGFKVYERLTRYFEPVDVICVTRRSQTSNTSLWHNRARRFNFYLRGFKYLIIVRKPDGEGGTNRLRSRANWAYYARGSGPTMSSDSEANGL